jgi:hypothetical protein
MFLKMGASSLHSDDTDTTGTTWNGGQWINIAVVADRSSNTKFYKNGILSSTYNSSSTGYSATATSSQFIIGGTQTTVASSTAVSNDFNGYMGQIQIYAEALSHDEIRQNFNANRGIYGV